MRDFKIKKIFLLTGTLVTVYILYALIAGVFIFAFHDHENSSYMESLDPTRFYGEKISQDRVVLVEDRFESGIARINVIENAQESLDLSYHTVHAGTSSDILFASLVDAADRGVHVRILLDGLFHNLRGDLKDVMYSYSYHPNIELKFYEPLDVLRPWTWNNRLHDKMILVDNELAMIGGRNIADKYFGPDGYNGASNDRDVLLINTDLGNFEDSAIYAMKNYFDDVWNHEFSYYAVSELTENQERRGRNRTEELRVLLESMHESHSDLFHQEINWLEKSVPTNNVTFIHNPIERLNKEPWVWYEITSLMGIAEQSIFIQSPYIIPTDKMLQHVNQDEISVKEVSFLTNSLAATPNVLAYSGYRMHRETIASSEANVYEFQGPTESLHGKTFIFDNRISVVGSFNVDARSAYLSTEVMVVIDSEEFADQLNREIDHYIHEGSLQVSPDGSYHPHPSVAEEEASVVKRSVTVMLSWITRFLDYML
ncbi:phospholipase D family protein [Evansella sp. AB-P1]|uniref:phospholipase D family protein n=1 Tax=Evansella sp. AB-P1 TaxID=3037653 RepID=UPI00241F8BBD|nr:phospholipase D family protein [Evansella sp. AB-P1]MDG5785989.1 phospholipase D family protein [Evansella sp. AB-P1]